MNANTYNQIKTKFQEITDNHAQLRRFNMGPVYDIETFIGQSSDYPVLWIAPVDVTIGEQMLTYKFNILIFDLILKDKSNEIDVLSDTLRTMIDIVKELRFDIDDLEITGDFTATPFTEEFSDYVTGHRIEIDVVTSIEDNLCSTYPTK